MHTHTHKKTLAMPRVKSFSKTNTKINDKHPLHKHNQHKGRIKAGEYISQTWDPLNNNNNNFLSTTKHLKRIQLSDKKLTSTVV